MDEELIDPNPLHVSLEPIAGIQFILAAWVPSKGWLVTKRGLSVTGDLSGLGDTPEARAEALFMLEAKGGYRAMTHRLKREKVSLAGEPVE